MPAADVTGVQQRAVVGGEILADDLTGHRTPARRLLEADEDCLDRWVQHRLVPENEAALRMEAECAHLAALAAECDDHGWA